MRWCRFKVDGRKVYGRVDGDNVIEVEGHPFTGYKETKTVHPLSKVKILLPLWVNNFYTVGVNYAEHVTKMRAMRGEPANLPTKPDIGYRAVNALIAHDEDIVKPKDASPTNFHYEGELVAIFGKKLKHVSKDEAIDAVFGWTIGNDVSERTWQKQDRTFWRCKNADTFKPMGPWITTGITQDDINKMVTTTRMNGEVTDEFHTADMIFDAATFISETTKYCTIYPGDVMWLGTGAMPHNMVPGDVCEIEITGLGTLRNRIVAEA